MQPTTTRPWVAERPGARRLRRAGRPADAPSETDTPPPDRKAEAAFTASEPEPPRHGTFEIDELGRFVHISSGIEGIFGVREAEVIGTPAFRAVEDGDRERALLAFDESRSGKGSPERLHTYRMQTSRGETRIVRVTIQFFRDATGRLRGLGSLYDVTTQSAAEDSLAAQLEYAQFIARLSRRLIDVEADDLEQVVTESIGEAGTLLGADRAFLFFGLRARGEFDEAYGWSREGVALSPPPRDTESNRRFMWGMSIRDGETIHVRRLSDLPDAAVNERRSLEARGVCAFAALPISTASGLDGYLSFEWTGEARDGAELELDWISIVARLTTNAVRRCRAESALKIQVEGASKIAELSSHFIELPSDEIDEGIAWGLAEAARLADADRCYVLEVGRLDDGRDTYQWHDDRVPAYTPRLPRARLKDYPWATGQAFDHGVFHNPDTRSLPAEAVAERAHHLEHGIQSSLGVMLRAEGRPVGYLGFESILKRKRWTEAEITNLRLVAQVFGNLLHRKRSEGQLAQSRAELMQAQKMEAMGRMAGGIAHDFNNLLTVVLGNSAALVEGLPPGDPHREEAEDIHSAAERAASLTRQLLSFTRNHPVASTPVDLSSVVGGLGRMISHLLGEAVTYVWRPSESPANVRVAATELEQVVVNLLVNARLAVEPQGRVEVSVDFECLEATRAIALGMVEPGEAVVLNVVDDGCGMDAATRQHVFDPFFTTREPGQGSGLGLSIVYAIARQAGGAVEVRSEKGKGARFSVYFPRCFDAVESAPQHDAEPAPRGPAKVLLVEDEDSVRRLTRRTLERAGYQVIEAANGEAAIELAKQTEKIDLLLSDVVMPRLGGVELARRLRETHPGLPVLLMSGYPDPDRKGGPTGPVTEALLDKPFSASVLLRRIGECLAD